MYAASVLYLDSVLLDSYIIVAIVNMNASILRTEPNSRL